MDKASHRIAGVKPGSIAEELELSPGDVVLRANGQDIGDIFDYYYLLADEEVTLLVEKPDGEQWELEIEKDADEDIGITFENGLMDGYRSCSNRCIFCFIDQMPQGLRQTLYFKDDDSRLSFMQGNYVTLTNMGERDVERIIRYRLDPINISVHTTNPGLRCMMLRNRFAGDSLRLLDRFAEAGIRMNAQIVLCRGINDGAELDRTIGDLMKYMPSMESVSVVPVGLTRFRAGLYPLEPFTREDAARLLGQIRGWQEKCMESGTHFVHAGDEWYLLAGEPLPPEENYDGYPQLENGVGMLRLFYEEFAEAMDALPGDSGIRRELSIATGTLAAPHIERLIGELKGKYPGITVHVYPIRNDFFGERITVSGLVTGADIKKQLSAARLGGRLLLPCSMVRREERDFLDGVTVAELEKTLQVPIDIVESSGMDFLNAILGEG